MKRLGPLAAVVALVSGSFFAGQEVASPPAVPSPCPDGFEYHEISQDVATKTCTSDPFVVIIGPDGNAIRAFDTSGAGEVDISEVPGWSE